MRSLTLDQFERGTISYMITATLTRPTTITPVIISERKLYYVERIDVATFAAPPSRTITLEPVVRRPRARHQARRLVDSARQSSDPAPFGTIYPAYSSTYPENTAPASPVLSDISFDDTLSATRASQSESQYQSSLTGSDSVAVTHSGASLQNKVITATVQPYVGACLRGDHISVRIVVNHIKQVKSLYGVIITFFRHARVDLQPDRTSAQRGQGSSQQEDVYPRSLTGLSGLSLSNAGSVHVFRKDLSQVMVPLLVDPQTLNAEMTAKVRVPDDAFPTISNVPGAMISFRYYVEAVLDIQGKLAGLDRGFGSLQSGAPPEHVVLADAGDRDRAMQSALGQTVVDTLPVRRDREVVHCQLRDCRRHAKQWAAEGKAKGRCRSCRPRDPRHTRRRFGVAVKNPSQQLRADILVWLRLSGSGGAIRQLGLRLGSRQRKCQRQRSEQQMASRGTTVIRRSQCRHVSASSTSAGADA